MSSNQQKDCGGHPSGIYKFPIPTRLKKSTDEDGNVITIMLYNNRTNIEKPVPIMTPAHILVHSDGSVVDPPGGPNPDIMCIQWVRSYKQWVHKDLIVPDDKLPGVDANKSTRTRRKPVKLEPDVAVSSAAVAKPKRRPPGRKKTTTKPPTQKSTQSKVQVPDPVKSEEGVSTDDECIETILSSNTTHLANNNNIIGGDAIVQSVVTQPTNVTSGYDINCYDLPTDDEAEGKRKAETNTSSSSTTRPTNLNIANNDNVDISKRPLSGRSKAKQLPPPKSNKSNNKNLASSHPALLNSNSTDSDGGNLHPSANNNSPPLFAASAASLTEGNLLPFIDLINPLPEQPKFVNAEVRYIKDLKKWLVEYAEDHNARAQNTASHQEDFPFIEMVLNNTRDGAANETTAASSLPPLLYEGSNNDNAMGVPKRNGRFSREGVSSTASLNQPFNDYYGTASDVAGATDGGGGGTPLADDRKIAAKPPTDQGINSNNVTTSSDGRKPPPAAKPADDGGGLTNTVAAAAASVFGAMQQAICAPAGFMSQQFEHDERNEAFASSDALEQCDEEEDNNNNTLSTGASFIISMLKTVTQKSAITSAQHSSGPLSLFNSHIHPPTSSSTNSEPMQDAGKKLTPKIEEFMLEGLKSKSRKEAASENMCTHASDLLEEQIDDVNYAAKIVGLHTKEGGYSKQQLALYHNTSKELSKIDLVKSSSASDGGIIRYDMSIDAVTAALRKVVLDVSGISNRLISLTLGDRKSTNNKCFTLTCEKEDKDELHIHVHMCIEPENLYEFNRPIIKALIDVLLGTPEARERFHSAMIYTTDSNGGTWSRNKQGTYLHLWIIERVMVGTKREPEPFSNTLKKWRCPRDDCTHYNYKDFASNTSTANPRCSGCDMTTVLNKWLARAKVVKPIDL